MPQPVNVTKAILKEVWWDDTGAPKYKSPAGIDSKSFTVQFNPQTLKLSSSNQTSGGDGGKKDAPPQFTARQSTKLSLELWFDVTLAVAEGRVLKGSGENKADVRALTQEIAHFLIPQQASQSAKDTVAPPGVEFTWGNLVFRGMMETMDETIDLFSPDGIALRASVSISITEFKSLYKPNPLLVQPPPAGTQPLQATNLGDNLQQMAAKAGVSNWQSIATANNIDNPRQLGAGTLLNFSG